MAEVEEHFANIRNQVECLEEHGHLTSPDEFVAMFELSEAAEKAETVFKKNQIMHDSSLPCQRSEKIRKPPDRPNGP